MWPSFTGVLLIGKLILLYAGDAFDKLTASCHVDTMAAVSWNYVGKNVKITSEWQPSVHNRINNLSMKV